MNPLLAALLASLSTEQVAALLTDLNSQQEIPDEDRRFLDMTASMMCSAQFLAETDLEKDCFNSAESDLDYFLRRKRELGLGLP